MRNILLIAGLQERYYFEPFLKALEDTNVSIHICDPSRYPLEATFSVVQDGNAISGFIETIQIRDAYVVPIR